MIVQSYRRHCVIGVMLGLLCILLDAASKKKFKQKPVEEHTMRVIMFDLGDTLVSVDWWSITKEIGVTDAARYWIKYRSGESLKTRLDQVLEAVYGEQAVEDQITICDAKGRPQPLAMVNWFTGTLSGADIIKNCHAYLLHKRRIDGGDSVEQRVLYNLIETVFSAHSMANALKPLPGALRLLEDLSTSGCRLMLVSNIAPDVFRAFLTTDFGERILNYIKPEDCIISGVIGCAKPDLRILRYACDHAEVTPEQVVFIDDQRENIEAAERLGMRTIQVIKGKLAPVRRKLVSFGVEL